MHLASAPILAKLSVGAADDVLYKLNDQIVIIYRDGYHTYVWVPGGEAIAIYKEIGSETRRRLILCKNPHGPCICCRNAKGCKNPYGLCPCCRNTSPITFRIPSAAEVTAFIRSHPGLAKASDRAGYPWELNLQPSEADYGKSFPRLCSYNNLQRADDLRPHSQKRTLGAAFAMSSPLDCGSVCFVYPTLAYYEPWYINYQCSPETLNPVSVAHLVEELKSPKQEGAKKMDPKNNPLTPNGGPYDGVQPRPEPKPNKWNEPRRAAVGMAIALIIASLVIGFTAVLDLNEIDEQKEKKLIEVKRPEGTRPPNIGDVGRLAYEDAANDRYYYVIHDADSPAAVVSVARNQVDNLSGSGKPTRGSKIMVTPPQQPDSFSVIIPVPPKEVIWYQGTEWVVINERPPITYDEWNGMPESAKWRSKTPAVLTIRQLADKSKILTVPVCR